MSSPVLKVDERTDLDCLKARARDGCLESAFQLGMRYTRGYSTPRDYRAALMWFTHAANENHAYAQFRLGMAYFLGYGVKKDLFEAAIWFSAAVAPGVQEAIAALEIVRLEWWRSRFK